MREVIALVSAPSGFAGAVGPLPVETPWWNHVEPVNAALEGVLGVPCSVLRLVSTTGRGMRGGVVTYHVEAHGEPDRSQLHPGERPSCDAPKRLPWARLGGPAELVAWADEHVTRTGPAVQVRTWNLSSLHRLPTADGPVWLKALPPFASDEAALIKTVAACDPPLVPRVLADAPGRLLLSHVPGEDCWNLTPEVIREIVPRYVAVQAKLAGPNPGVQPRPVAMPSFGLPDTLVHGDFYPGNWRSSGVVIDWADSTWGHPAYDAARLIAFTEDPSLHHLITEVWSHAWRTHFPDSEPELALRTARPVAHLLTAVKYQEFLDNIEDSERVYHEGDPAEELRTAQSLAG
ncbi:hypothetical protein Lesp02_24630 [Lentzea sp. NBRC 105346]|uniref:phosphotransferase n=1 Tax=Lentzea sp. NBRC 105346 TaxID=3032205 RepID=UPI0024A546C0|nr:phosphotransferase [Lentzea sp. NBRC 105346]GLZ30273.1 hypothetical protein Lesp02_24630 [Lentzea sp. NBRC 105346]